jgi:hypothetical protein
MRQSPRTFLSRLTTTRTSRPASVTLVRVCRVHDVALAVFGSLFRHADAHARTAMHADGFLLLGRRLAAMEHLEHLECGLQPLSPGTPASAAL